MGLKRFIRKAAPVVAVVVAVVAPELAPAIGEALGAAAGSAEAAALGSAAIAGGTSLAAGATPQQAAKSAVSAGIGSEIASTIAPDVSQTLGTSPETTKSIATGLGTTGGALATGSNLQDAATRGLISGSVQEIFGTPAADASTAEKLATAFAKQYATQALGDIFMPAKTTTSTYSPTSPQTSVTTTGAGASPGSAALAQALRTDLGAPIFGSDKDKEGRKSGWNVESLRYMGNVGEA